MKLSCGRTGGKAWYKVNDVEVTKEEYDAAWAKVQERRRRFGGGQTVEELLAGEIDVATDRPSCWPHTSSAAGVHPKQVDEANAILKAAGSRCYHTKDGKLQSPSRAEFKRMLRIKGLRDFGAFN